MAKKAKIQISVHMLENLVEIAITKHKDMAKKSAKTHTRTLLYSLK